MQAKAKASKVPGSRRITVVRGTVTVRKAKQIPASARTLVPVSERALIQRINRVLKPNQVLKLTRGQQLRNECGDWYVLDLHRNNIVQHARFKDLAEMARELGALQEWEVLS